MDGDGVIYVSDDHTLVLSGVKYVATAYQHLTCKFVGLMSKKLVCFKSCRTESGSAVWTRKPSIWVVGLGTSRSQRLS